MAETMSDEVVKIKGTTSGLLLLFSAGATYAEIEAELRQKLATGSGFFSRGTVMHATEGSLPEKEMQKLQQIFEAAGLVFRVTRRRSPVRRKPEPKVSAPTQTASDPIPVQPQAQPQDDEAVQMVVVNRTLRGGQEIRTKSSVLVCGNVNPGAQIIAGGSIDIRGTCRGMVHAGAFGNQKAFVVADHLMPTQIRIADLIARSPDTAPGDLEKTTKPERASVKDGQIVIEPIDR